MLDAAKKTSAGYSEGLVSVATNMGLFVLKMWAGMVTGSIAITADAWHTLSDSTSSLIVIVAVKLASKKPDKKHPFGYGRWEQIAALFIGVFLAIIAYGFLKDAILRFVNHETIVFGTIAIVVTSISVVVKEALAQYAFGVGRKTGNLAVKADGWHHRTDALSSLVLLAGILFANRFWWIDSVMGIILSLMLFWATYEIFREAINKLLGEQPPAELIRQIEAEIKPCYNGNCQPHHYHIHNYVAHQELTFHIKLGNHLSVESGHKIATEMENKVYEAFGIIATIHVEPYHYDHSSD
ncbi:MAG: cation diffusion facilitator family transporter [Bacteroidales bacterium]